MTGSNNAESDNAGKAETTTATTQSAKEKNPEQSSSKTITKIKQRSGSCYCGAITVTVKDKPIGVSICHCTTCQRLNGTPFGIQSLHKPNNFTLTYNRTKSDDKKDENDGADKNDGGLEGGEKNKSNSWKEESRLWSIQSSKNVTRYRCKECGSPVYATLQQGRMIVVPRTMLFQHQNSCDDRNNKMINDPNYQPTHHMYYGSRIIDVKDNLPKYIGGSHPTRGILYTKNEEAKQEKDASNMKK